MNLSFGLFCSAGVLFNSSELGFDVFAFETWRKDYWFLFFICSLVWFLYTAKCEFSSKLRVYIKVPRVVLVLRWVLFVPEIFVFPPSEFEQNMYSSDPRPDAGSSMQLESCRAVPQASQPHNPKPQPGHFNNSTTRRPRSEKPLQISGSRTFLSFSCKTRELP